uniref:Uncharacterized protein n=1 Tax=Meloidogyne incognita TaxID=6306 RepID=A0A914LVT6_MELIC
MPNSTKENISKVFYHKGPPRSFQSFLTKILFWRCFSSTCRMGVDLIEISNRKGF